MYATCPWPEFEERVSVCICHSPVLLARITRRRAEVLALLLEFEPNAAMAARLVVSPKTLARELDDLRMITGCRTKGELAHWWTRHAPIWADRLGLAVA